MAHRSTRPALLPLALLVLLVSNAGAAAGDHLVISWNDLGMHPLTRDHAVLSIQPPHNTLHAQVVRVGDRFTPSVLVTDGVTVEYSIPGNTYSVGKTDFWTWDEDLFGVDLPDDTGLTGLGLAGDFTLDGTRFVADGIPVTPFSDAAPAVEAPYQLGLVIARNAQGVELARSRPVLPVSTELGCTAVGCHANDQAIVDDHPPGPGYNPNFTPIFCAGCHASPILGTPGDPMAGWFSFRIHDNHRFIELVTPGQDACYACHPGPLTACNRGVMADGFGMICQDCHGGMAEIADSIDQQGRIPWQDEPACGDCHLPQYAEPAGQLYRESTGHGGLYCSACHGSPHAEFPSREAADNVMMEELQGVAGNLIDCTVCHGDVPADPGPHGWSPTVDVAELELERDAGRLHVYPSPLRPGDATTIKALDAGEAAGRLLVYDARGRAVRLLRPRTRDGAAVAAWDGRDGDGEPVASGVYFLRWTEGARRASGKVVVAR